MNKPKQKLDKEQYRRKMRSWRETHLPKLQQRMAMRLLERIGKVQQDVIQRQVRMHERVRIDLEYLVKVAVMDWMALESKIAPMLRGMDIKISHEFKKDGKVEIDISEDFETLCEGRLFGVDIFTSDHPSYLYEVV